MTLVSHQIISVQADQVNTSDHALKVRRLLNEAGVMALNIMGDSGCGKTSLIEQTAAKLKGQISCAIISSDNGTGLDAKQYSELGIPLVQLNIKGSHYVTANMLLECLKHLDLTKIDLLLIENLGNTCCPANQDLGTDKTIACLSVAQGWGVIEKHRELYSTSSLNILTKTDLAGTMEFNIPRTVSMLKRMNNSAPVIATSTNSGDGIDTFCLCIKREWDSLSCEA